MSRVPAPQHLSPDVVHNATYGCLDSTFELDTTRALSIQSQIEQSRPRGIRLRYGPVRPHPPDFPDGPSVNNITSARVKPDVTVNPR